MRIESENVPWENMTRDHLEHLLIDKGMTNSEIAKSFGIGISKVQYKRKKHGLSSDYVMFKKFIKGDDQELVNSINEIARSWFLNKENIDIIAKSIVNYAFRQGPVENTHNKGEPITDQDMKAINIYMVNHIAGLLLCAVNGDWGKLHLLLSYFNRGMSEWEPANPEMEKIEKVTLQLLGKTTLLYVTK